MASTRTAFLGALLLASCETTIDPVEICAVAQNDCNTRNLCWRLLTEGSGSASGSFDPASKKVAVSIDVNGKCNIECVSCSAAEPRGTGATTPPNSSNPSLDEAVDLFSRISCANEFVCNPIGMNFYVGDLRNCQTQRRSWLLWASRLPGSGITTESLRNCTNTVIEGGCNDFLDACVFGQREVGEPCATHEQCKTSSCSAQDYQCGSCLPASRVGNSCTDDSPCLLTSLHCEAGRCVANGSEGQSCDSTKPCASSLRCVDGVCRPKPNKAGASCTGEQECDAAEMLDCDAKAASCKIVYFADPGQKCPEFGWCRYVGGCLNGVCAAGPVTGQSCNSDLGCQWPSACVNGVCRGIPAIDPCQVSAEARSPGTTSDAGFTGLEWEGLSP